MKKITKNLSTFLTLLTFASCGQDYTAGVNQAFNFEQTMQIFQIGRSIERAHGREMSNLESFKIRGAYELELQQSNDYVNYLAFNTDEMESVPESQLLIHSEGLVEEFSKGLGVESRELKLMENQPLQITPNMLSINYVRHVEDFYVRDSFLELIFVRGENGEFKIREILNQTYPGAEIQEANSKVSVDNNLKTIAEQLDLENSSQKDHQKILMPRFGADHKIVLVPSEQVSLKSRKNETEWVTVTLSNVTGENLETYSNHVFEGEQVLKTESLDRSYLKKKSLTPFPLVSGKQGSVSFTTNESGKLSAPLTKGQSTTATLDSSRVTVKRGSTTQTATFTYDDAGVSVSESDFRAVNAFQATQKINRFARRHLTDKEASILGNPVTTYIDVTDSCNAYYTGMTVNLFSQGGQCANMALVNDVMYHEWGHGLDDYTGKNKGITDSAFSEAIGDILSAYYSKNSNLGEGFYLNKETGIRQLQNTKKFPGDVGGEPHSDGLIIGGAFWDLRQLLVKKHGEVKGSYLAEMFFLKHLTTTDSYKDSYRAVARLDDDDGNPATPSPNECLIIEAFANHGLATANPSCVNGVDKKAELLAVEPSLQLGVKDNKSGQIDTIYAASKYPRVQMCTGEFAACAADEKLRTELDSEGRKGLNATFQKTVSIPVNKDPNIIHLFSLNRLGKLIGARSFKLMPK